MNRVIVYINSSSLGVLLRLLYVGLLYTMMRLFSGCITSEEREEKIVAKYRVSNRDRTSLSNDYETQRVAYLACGLPF